MSESSLSLQEPVFRSSPNDGIDDDFVALACIPFVVVVVVVGSTEDGLPRSECLVVEDLVRLLSSSSV